MTSNGLPKCGGSLISATEIVTSADCMSGVSCDSESSFICGAHNYELPGGVEQTRTCASIKYPPGFDPACPHAHDICIVTVSEPYSLTSRVNTICLPNAGQSFDDQTCILTGM